MQHLPPSINTDPVNGKAAIVDAVGGPDFSVGGIEVFVEVGGTNSVGVEPLVPQPVRNKSIAPIQIIS